MQGASSAANVAASAAPPRVELLRPGLVPYAEALAFQRERAEAIRAGGAPEALVLLQHPPVYTLGRRTDPAHVLLPRPLLAARGAQVVEVERGGDVTFHGPGQLVAYPLLHLRRRGIGPADYIHRLEEAMQRTLARWGVDAERSPGRPGIWVGQRKIGAVGVRVRGGVSLHGLALNVDPDLAWFDLIVPCGLPDVRVTSMASEGVDARVDAVGDALLEDLATVLGLDYTGPLPSGAAL